LTFRPLSFGFTKQEFLPANFGFNKFVDFVCLPELDAFFVMDVNQAGDAKKIVAMRGNSYNNGMNRVIASFDIESFIEEFKVYADSGRAVILTYNDDSLVHQQLSINISGPELVAVATNVPGDKIGKSIPFDVTFAPNGADASVKQTVSGSFNVLEPLPTPTKPEIRGDKQSTTSDINVSQGLKLQRMHIDDCALFYGDDPISTTERNIAFLESAFEHRLDFKPLGMKVGNIERFSKTGGSDTIDVDLISYYANSGEITSLDFGMLELYEYEQMDGKPPVKLDSLTLPFNFKSVSSALGSTTLYSAILTNEGTTSSLKLAISKNKFSTLVRDIKIVTFLSYAEVFIVPNSSL
jgi:hypothetical protein